MKPIRTVSVIKTEIVTEFQVSKRTPIQKFLANFECMTRKDASENIGIVRTTLNKWVIRMLSLDDFFEARIAIENAYNSLKPGYPYREFLKSSLHYYQVWAIDTAYVFFGNQKGNEKLTEEEIDQKIITNKHLFSLERYKREHEEYQGSSSRDWDNT